MKKWLYFLIWCFCWGCQEKPQYPVYSVGLDHPDQVAVTDLFVSVKAIPLETTEKSHFIMGELGMKNDRYYILDRNQQLFFCFDTTGKYRYVMDNKPKGKDKQPGNQYRSILTPYSYYYNKKWYYYLTFRTEVYTKDKNGNHKTMYSWDFGKYNDDRELRVSFPPLAPAMVAPIQQAWLKENSAFALSNARQNKDYIYTSLERLDSLDSNRFYHLFCYKPTGKCFYFHQFTDGTTFSQSLRLEDHYILMLLPWWEKEKYENLSLLDQQSRQIVSSLKAGDNPVVLKWYLK